MSERERFIDEYFKRVNCVANEKLLIVTSLVLCFAINWHHKPLQYFDSLKRLVYFIPGLKSLYK